MGEERDGTIDRTIGPMRRLLLLANPSASGFTGALYRDVVAILSSAYDVETGWPLDARESRRLSSEAEGDGFAVVAAMGGDGIVHHVANGIAGTGVSLGIIPAGTTNVAARIFGLPRKPKRAAALIGRLPPTPTRVARIESMNGGTSSVEYATFAVGVGFDAAVVERAERRPHSKIWFGGAHYAESAVMTLLADWRGRPANLRVDVDGTRVDGVAALTQVHHPYTYFGPVPLHITRDPVEGLSAVVAEDLGVHRSAEIFARAMLRRRLVERLRAPVFSRFERLTIDAEPAAPFQADGEHLGFADRIEIAPFDNGLLVVRDPTKCCTERGSG